MGIILEQIMQLISSTETFTAYIGAIIGGIMTILGSIVFWWFQQRVELKNIARGLFFDISNLEGRFKEFIDMHEKTNIIAQKMAKELRTKVEHKIMSSPIPFYDDNGLFYVFSKDIARFDSKLSSKLYDFYIKVGYIETLRARIDQFQERNNLTEFDHGVIDVDYGIMVESVKEAQKLILIIKQDLKEKYHI